MKKNISYLFAFFLILVPLHIKADPLSLMSPMPNHKVAPDFELIGFDENYYTLKDFRGKFVLLNFWATWCYPCIEEMPSLEAVFQHMDDTKFLVVGIHAGPGPDNIKEFLKRNPVTFPILIDMDLELGPPDWKIAGIPTTFLINPEGKMLYFAQGKRDFSSRRMISFFEEIVNKHYR